MNKKIQNWRWVVKSAAFALFILIPFIKPGGESLLRFDLQTLNLHFFGLTIAIQNFFIVLLLLFVITFVFILITQLFGRIWCGWLCPQTVINDFTAFMDKLKGKPAVKKALSHLVLLLISALIGACMVWYFVDPYEFITDAAAGRLGGAAKGFWIALTVITYLNFAFMRHTFCKTICPYSKLQSVMYDKHTLIIALDPDRADECIKCRACVKVCPVGIDIREGLDSACIHCASCVDACRGVMQKQGGKKTLINYFFGFEKQTAWFRTNVLITFAATVVFTALLIYNTATIGAFEFKVFPNQQFLPKQSGDSFINSYDILIRNTTGGDVNIEIGVEGLEGYRLQPEGEVTLDSGQTLEKTFYLIIPAEKLAGRQLLSLRMKAEADDEENTEIYSEISFRKPLGAKN